MNKIKVITITSNSILPRAYKTWGSLWERKKGKNISECSNINCNDLVEEVGFVSTFHDSKNYLIPLCEACKETRNELVVNEEKLLSLDYLQTLNRFFY
jgi:hypothetical protein